MPTPLKQTLVALKEAFELSLSKGEPVALELGVDVSRPLLNNLAFALGYSFSWVEVPGGGWRLEGEGGEFTLNVPNPTP